MRKNKKAASISTFIEAGVSIEGTITFENTIRLDGKLKGKISGNSGTVIIGEKGDMQADINAAVVVIMGQVQGTVVATERIEIYPPARVAGDIQAPVVSIESGVVFNGNCSMKVPQISSERGNDAKKQLPSGKENKGNKIL
ncbi:polymer-forming cytoskeletal protein [Desulfococcaceae bacterium HSG7]|nr:polymer-forming cytoskeletal protein [Desulfococcaceae bacterium HSG9]MDM8556004.1 polymer-forming cytoskeletal protein [Desulfococcaceae bacterium HSG7]